MGVLAICGLCMWSVVPAQAAKPPKPRTADELATAVSASGHGCTDYAPLEPRKFAGLPRPKSQGQCTIDGELSTLSLFASSHDLRAILKAVPTIGCSTVSGATEFHYVSAPSWTISTNSATGPNLAKALGAKSLVFHCKS
jgi:hypothetical protein